MSILVRVLPYYIPPSLLLRQFSVLTLLNDATGWWPGERWIKGINRLLRIAGGAKKFGCFGYEPHPVYEVTARCNLYCMHCHARGGEPYPGELGTEEAKRVIDNLTTVRDFRMLVFTGGEPLMRKDIMDLTNYAHDLGFNIVYASNATLITPSIAHKMAKNGVVGVAVSLDSVYPYKHDEFRGVKGAWKRAMNGMKNIINAGMYLQINITVSKINLDEFEMIIRLADRIGAHVILLYNFIESGRGLNKGGIALNSMEYMRVIERVSEIQDEVECVIAPVAAPWYYAYLASKSRIPIKLIENIVSGCIAARGMFYIKPDGEVWPCPFIPISGGNVAKEPAIKIWTGRLFKLIRDRENLGEPCKSCLYRGVCGGCRARTFVYTGEIMNGDPVCPLKNDRVMIKKTVKNKYMLG